MKKTIGYGKSHERTKLLKSNAWAAEHELIHLENVMRGLLRASSADLPVGPQYWRGRVKDVDRDFELLPVQLARLANVTKMLSEIEQSIDQANHSTSRSVAV